MTVAQEANGNPRVTRRDLTQFLRYLLVMRWAHWMWLLPAFVTVTQMAVDDPKSFQEPSLLWSAIAAGGFWNPATHFATYLLACLLLVLNYNGIYGFRFKAANPRVARLFHPATAALFGGMGILFALDAAMDREIFVRAAEALFALLSMISAYAQHVEERRQSLGKDAGQVVAFVTSLANERDCRKAPPPKNLRWGMEFAVWTAICGFAAVLLPQPLKAFLPFLSLYLIARAKYLFQPQFNALLQEDPRPPVLYLRSFRADEQVKFSRINRQSNDGTLEQRLARHFGGRGPFIAIGAPQNPLVLGAVRTVLGPDEWQGRVMGWMQSSSAIVLVVGTTKWIDWELKKIFDLGDLEKLVLIFPPVRKRLRGRAEKEAGLHLAAAQTALKGTKWEESMAELGDPLRLRSLVFHADGAVEVVVCRSRNILSYEWAAFLAHYWQNQASATPFVRECRDIRASKGRRRAATLVDVLLICGAWAPLGLIVWYHAFDAVSAALAAAGVIALLLYFAICEGWFGASCGQALASIRVVRDDGRRLGFRTGLMRIALSLVDGNFRGIRETVTQTELVENKYGSGARAVAATAWIAIVGLGISSAMLLYRAAPARLFAPKGFEEIPAASVSQSTGKLEAGDLAFTQERNGAARSNVYQAGDRVDLQYELIGFGRDSSGRANIQVNYQVLEPDGTPAGQEPPMEFNDPIAFADPALLWIELPTNICAPPGSYQIKVMAKDAVKNSDLAFTTEFQIANGATCHLQILGLQFVVPGAAATATPVVKMGDSLQMQCMV
ncbi:MAG: RDD family protein, partial [Terracidiphilus sp.]